MKSQDNDKVKASDHPTFNMTALSQELNSNLPQNNIVSQSLNIDNKNKANQSLNIDNNINHINRGTDYSNPIFQYNSAYSSNLRMHQNINASLPPPVPSERLGSKPIGIPIKKSPSPTSPTHKLGGQQVAFSCPPRAPFIGSLPAPTWITHEMPSLALPPPSPNVREFVINENVSTTDINNINDQNKKCETPKMTMNNNFVKHSKQYKYASSAPSSMLFYSSRTNPRSMFSGKILPAGKQSPTSGAVNIGFDYVGTNNSPNQQLVGISTFSSDISQQSSIKIPTLDLDNETSNKSNNENLFQNSITMNDDKSPTVFNILKSCPPGSLPRENHIGPYTKSSDGGSLITPPRKVEFFGKLKPGLSNNNRLSSGSNYSNNSNNSNTPNENDKSRNNSGSLSPFGRGRLSSGSGGSNNSNRRRARTNSAGSSIIEEGEEPDEQDHLDTFFEFDEN